MLRCRQGRAAGKTWWNHWLLKGPGQEGEELDDEDDMLWHKKGGLKTQMFAPCDLRKDEERRLKNPWVRTTQLSLLEVPPLFVLLEYGLGML